MYMVPVALHQQRQKAIYIEIHTAIFGFFANIRVNQNSENIYNLYYPFVVFVIPIQMGQCIVGTWRSRKGPQAVAGTVHDATSINVAAIELNIHDTIINAIIFSPRATYITAN